MNMENQALVKRAQELKEMGHSIRQISAELGISKSKVFRWLSNHADRMAPAPRTRTPAGILQSKNNTPLKLSVY